MEKNNKPTSIEAEKNNRFKGIDRVDRGKPSPHESGKNGVSAPNPNDGSHKPKIVPWK